MTQRDRHDGASRCSSPVSGFWCRAQRPQPSPVDGDAGSTIEGTLSRLKAGDTLVVRGTCKENVVIRTEAVRITLEGQGKATIQSSDSERDTMAVAGKNITIKGLPLTGGRDGIHVSGPAAVVLDGNIIRDNGRGIHLDQGVQLYEPQRHRLHAARYTGHDSGVCCRMIAAQSLRLLGYPDQAVVSSQVGLDLAQQLDHLFSLTVALTLAAMLHHCRREAPLAHARAEAAMTLATEQDFPQQLERARPVRSWALAARGHVREGITQICQALAADRPTGTTRDRPYNLALLAEASAQGGQTSEGLEALALLATSGVRWWEAELHRLRGKLLIQFGVQSPESSVVTHHAVRRTPYAAEAEACFQ